MTYLMKESKLGKREEHLHLVRGRDTGNVILLGLPGNGRQVLFSFGLAVAAFVPGLGYLRTDSQWSATTERHIREWIDGDSTTVPQEEIDEILFSVPRSEK